MKQALIAIEVDTFDSFLEVCGAFAIEKKLTGPELFAYVSLLKQRLTEQLGIQESTLKIEDVEESN